MIETVTIVKIWLLKLTEILLLPIAGAPLDVVEIDKIQQAVSRLLGCSIIKTLAELYNFIVK